MLIYNQNKKLIGIDDEDLNVLGFLNVNELLATCQDVAELFVKKPGYIHDFKNFEWIDFVLHADAESSKAIVQTPKKHFSCDIVIKPFYMTETPDEPAYAVYLQHVHGLSGEESAAAVTTPEPAAPAAAPVAEPSITMSEPEPFTAPEPSITTPEPEPFTLPELPSEEPSVTEPEPAALFESTLGDIEDEIPAAFSKPLDIEDDIFLAPEPEPEIIMPSPAVEPEPVADAPSAVPAAAGFYTADEQEYIDQLTVSGDYVFNPQVAADELGLPVDLIEEFIGDFIKQAHDFHDELFESAAKSDFDNVKILSHKLKGVAANLRVEDALEMLTVVNNSHDQIEVEANLKAFYRVIDKLEGKELPEITAAPAAAAAVVAEPALLPEEEPQIPETMEEDIYAFDLVKETEPEASAPEATEVSPAAEAEEEDIYAFDLPIAEPEVDTVSVEEDTDTPSAQTMEEDLYAFDLPSQESTDEEAASDEENTPSFEEPSFDDDDVELPPMDMSLLDEESAPAEESTPSFEEPSFDDDDIELPPMDMSHLDEETTPLEEAAPAEENTPSFEEPSFDDDDVELPPMDMSAFDEPAETVEETPTEPAAVLNYDAAQAAAELGLPASLVEELQKDFANDARGCKSDMELAISSDNAERWQSAASTLKGAADNLRMNEIAETLKVLSQTSDVTEAQVAISKLYNYVDQL